MFNNEVIGLPIIMDRLKIQLLQRVVLLRKISLFPLESRFIIIKYLYLIDIINRNPSVLRENYALAERA